MPLNGRTEQTRAAHNPTSTACTTGWQLPPPTNTTVRVIYVTYQYQAHQAWRVALPTPPSLATSRGAAEDTVPTHEILEYPAAPELPTAVEGGRKSRTSNSNTVCVRRPAACRLLSRLKSWSNQPTVLLCPQRQHTVQQYLLCFCAFPVRERCGLKVGGGDCEKSAAVNQTFAEHCGRPKRRQFQRASRPCNSRQQDETLKRLPDAAPLFASRHRRREISCSVAVTLFHKPCGREPQNPSTLPREPRKVQATAVTHRLQWVRRNYKKWRNNCVCACFLRRQKSPLPT